MARSVRGQPLAPVTKLGCGRWENESWVSAATESRIDSLTPPSCGIPSHQFTVSSGCLPNCSSLGNIQMAIKIEQRPSRRESAANAQTYTLLGSQTPFVRGYTETGEENCVHVDFFGCPGPYNDNSSSFDYRVSLEAADVINLLIQMNPDSISAAIEEVRQSYGPTEQARRFIDQRLAQVLSQLGH
jgi:hypothetical protein